MLQLLLLVLLLSHEMFSSLQPKGRLLYFSFRLLFFCLSNRACSAHLFAVRSPVLNAPKPSFVPYFIPSNGFLLAVFPVACQSVYLPAWVPLFKLMLPHTNTRIYILHLFDIVMKFCIYSQHKCDIHQLLALVFLAKRVYSCCILPCLSLRWGLQRNVTFVLCV